MTQTLLHRQVYPIPDEGLKPVPDGTTHYALRRLADGPAVDLWRLGLEAERPPYQQIVLLEAERDALQKKVNALAEVAAGACQQRDALRAASEKLDAQMEILAGKHASLQAEVEAYRQQRDALAEDLRRSKAFQAEESAAIADLLAENERLRTSRPKCQHCGRPASCLGRYDTMPAWTFACDDCCGHGNEDGTCYALENVAFEFSHLDDAHRQAVEQRDALQAELRETGGIQAMARLNKKLTAQRDALADALLRLRTDVVVSGLSARIRDRARERGAENPIAIADAALRLAGRLRPEEPESSECGTG